MNEQIQPPVDPDPPESSPSREEAAYEAYARHSGSPWTGFGDDLRDGEPAAIKDLRRFHMEITYGASWARDSFDLRSRSLMTIAVLITLGDQEDQLARHIVRAERSGVSRDELVELMFHLTGYIGVPRVAKSLTIARRVWQEGTAA